MAVNVITRSLFVLSARRLSHPILTRQGHIVLCIHHTRFRQFVGAVDTAPATVLVIRTLLASFAQCSGYRGDLDGAKKARDQQGLKNMVPMDLWPLSFIILNYRYSITIRDLGN